MQFMNSGKARMVIKAWLVLLAFAGYSHGAESSRPLMRDFILYLFFMRL